MKDETEQLVRYVVERLRSGEGGEVYRAVFDALPVPIRIQDFDLITLDCNQAFCDLMGYEKSELVGRSIDVYIPEEARTQSLLARKAVVQELRENGAAQVRVAMQRGDGVILDLFLDVATITVQERDLIVVVYYRAKKLEELIKIPAVIQIETDQ